MAVLCNHQRAVPKTHDKSMANLDAKIEAKQDAIKEAEKQLKHAKKVSYKIAIGRVDVPKMPKIDNASEG